MRDLLTTAALTAALLSAAGSAAAQHHVPAPAADPAAHAGMAGPLGIPAARSGSGTAWLPDASPLHAIHGRLGEWGLMLHGSVYLQYIDQGSRRGDGELGSINWAMAMAHRPLAGGELALRTMLSAEPWTIRGCGYPLLLATGEVCDGEPIHDEQHPHDLFMEVAAQYQRALGRDLGLVLYGGPVGEPALGPAAYPHRPSAMANPLAPITHHWFDATHIAFGVATAGIFGHRWKVEGSLFNGREPDEHRTDFDLAPLDSYSGRAWLLPTDRWALQLSAARLHEAEPGHHAGDPRVDVARYTASATYVQPLPQGGSWAGTAALGHNVEQGEGTSAFFLESSMDLAHRHVIFSRSEWAQKAGHDLGLDHALEDELFSVGQLSVGYARQLGALGGWVPGVGVQASASFLPAELESYYGTRRPTGFTLFASLHPAPTGRSHDAHVPSLLRPTRPTDVPSRPGETGAVPTEPLLLPDPGPTVAGAPSAEALVRALRAEGVHLGAGAPARGAGGTTTTTFAVEGARTPNAALHLSAQRSAGAGRAATPGGWAAPAHTFHLGNLVVTLLADPARDAELVARVESAVRRLGGMRVPPAAGATEPHHPGHH